MYVDTQTRYVNSPYRNANSSARVNRQQESILLTRYG